MSAGFSFAEVQEFHLSQLKAFSQAISKNHRAVGLNTMNWQRVAYHADSKEYAKVIKDLQRK